MTVLTFIFYIYKNIQNHFINFKQLHNPQSHKIIIKFMESK